MLQIVIKLQIEQMLQDNQHPNDHLRRRARTRPRRSTLRPPCFERLGDHLNHGFFYVLEQCVDLAQPVGPQFVPIGQQNFEQTPLALSALDPCPL